MGSKWAANRVPKRAANWVSKRTVKWFRNGPSKINVHQKKNETEAQEEAALAPQVQLKECQKGRQCITLNTMAKRCQSFVYVCVIACECVCAPLAFEASLLSQ